MPNMSANRAEGGAMSHKMTLEDKAGAADALARWFERQDISPAQSCSVALMYLAACYLEAQRKKPSAPNLRKEIIGLFDSFVEVLGAK